MQDLLTPRRIKRKSKQPIIPIISCVIAGILLILLVILVPEKKKDKNFEEKSYYFVYTEKAGKESAVSGNVDLIKSLGGAAKIYNYRNNYHLIANVYLDKSSANEIVNGFKTTFSGSGVITIKSKEPSIKEIREIKSQANSFKVVKFLFEITEDFEKQQMDYLAGKISDSEISAWLIARKLKLEAIISEFDNEDEVFFTYANLCHTYFEYFFNKFFESTKKQSLVCEFYVNIVFCRIQMFDNL